MRHAARGKTRVAPMEVEREEVQENWPCLIWTYGFGSISVGIKNNLLGTWLLIYYNQVLGLDAILVSGAIAIALVVDAISDPFVGIWSDRVRSRWGRRHPFMYASIIPFSLCYYLILQDPGEISDSQMFTRLLILMILMRVAMTFYARCSQLLMRTRSPSWMASASASAQ